jgi:hypothetical protein
MKPCAAAPLEYLRSAEKRLRAERRAADTLPDEVTYSNPSTEEFKRKQLKSNQSLLESGVQAWASDGARR